MTGRVARSITCLRSPLLYFMSYLKRMKNHHIKLALNLKLHVPLMFHQQLNILPLHLPALQIYHIALLLLVLHLTKKVLFRRMR